MFNFGFTSVRFQGHVNGFNVWTVRFDGFEPRVIVIVR